MRAFILGASGYIGGSVAAKLLENGFQVAGLARSEESAKKLQSLGIEAIAGDLSDNSTIAAQAKLADIVINAANSDHRDAVETILKNIEGSNKIFIHTSGSSTVADKANGEYSDSIFDEETIFSPVPEKQARVELDKYILEASKNGLRSFVICPCLIYGVGLGAHKDSIQIPLLIKQAEESSIARHIGKGENIWSTVHIEDLANLYLLIAQKPPTPGTFFFAENGEVSFKELSHAVKKALCLNSEVENWPIEAASKAWGTGSAVFAMGSNSRIRAKNARAIGWSPKHNDVMNYVNDACKRLTKACC